MDSLLLLSAILAGLPVGLMLKTNFERNLRGDLIPWLPFGSGSLLRTLSGIFLVKLPLSLALFFGPPAALLISFRLLSLRGENLNAFWLLYLVAILFGKALRFFWWRSNA